MRRWHCARVEFLFQGRLPLPRLDRTHIEDFSRALAPSDPKHTSERIGRQVSL